MTKKYEKLLELIKLWDEFEQKQKSEDISDFGRWLMCLQNENNNTPKISETLSTEAEDHISFYKRMPEASQFLTLLSRSSRFLDFYIKKAFEDLAIGSRLEFQFLISIREMKNPRKTDIIYFNLVEISTGVETLKRLQKNGLIADLPDPEDKRIKRVKLTSKGEKLTQKALEKFHLLDNITQTFGRDESWKSMIPSLIWFNDFHNEIYHKHRDKSFEELLTYMGIGN